MSICLNILSRQIDIGVILNVEILVVIPDVWGIFLGQNGSLVLGLLHIKYRSNPIIGF